MRAKEEAIELMQEIEDRKKYTPDDWILDKKIKQVVNIRKEGKCIYMYLLPDNIRKLNKLKDELGCNNWNEFIELVLKHLETFEK